MSHTAHAPSAPAAPAVPPEAMELRARAEHLFALCKTQIVGRDPVLWPGEVIGASIAEQWIQNLVARTMRARAVALPR